MEATKSRDRMNPVSLKVTKFSNKSLRNFQKIPSYQVSLCLVSVTTTILQGARGRGRGLPCLQLLEKPKTYRRMVRFRLHGFALLASAACRH